MTTKQFYLLGEPVSSAKQIDVDTTSGIDGFKDQIAAHFAIVEPSGELLKNKVSQWLGFIIRPLDSH